jgi:hypothetical protein
MREGRDVEVADDENEYHTGRVLASREAWERSNTVGGVEGWSDALREPGRVAGGG